MIPTNKKEEKSKGQPMANTIDRVRQLIYASDKSFMTVSKETGIPYSTLTHWIYKGGSPNARNIADLCTYFNVSADWLLGLSDERNNI